MERVGAQTRFIAVPQSHTKESKLHKEASELFLRVPFAFPLRNFVK